MAKSNVERNGPVRRHPKLFFFGILTVVLVLAVYILYPVARSYYSAWRENGRLEAEYQALLDRNARIKEQVDALKTREGIEDWVRQQFGWVPAGEKAANITGLDINESSLGLPASVEPGSVEMSDLWWIKILDFIFGVEDPKPVNRSPEYIIPGL